jgi:hypothetical protein
VPAEEQPTAVFLPLCAEAEEEPVQPPVAVEEVVVVDVEGVWMDG